MIRHRCAALLAVGLTSAGAHASEPLPGVTWLPGGARAISRSDSASRDTPALELAYGPRAQASVGAEPGLLEVRRRSTTLRIGLYGLVGLENATSRRIFPPSELWRGLVGVSFAWELRHLARAWLPPGSDLEVALVVGHESDHATSGSTSRLSPPGPFAIPFGGGGDFVSFDVAERLRLGRTVALTVRLQDRIYFNELPLIFGARVASDTFADSLHEGLVNAPGAEMVLHVRATTWAEPRLALFGEHQLAHDAFVQDGHFFRAMAAVAFPGRAGELAPFLSFDGGNGKGLLIERRELRLSFGVRYAAF